MRKAAISIAKYDNKLNIVTETGIKEDFYCSSEMEEFFYKNEDLPVYGWYSDDYCSHIIVESNEYIKEWSKIKENHS